MILKSEYCKHLLHSVLYKSNAILKPWLDGDSEYLAIYPEEVGMARYEVDKCAGLLAGIASGVSEARGKYHLRTDMPGYYQIIQALKFRLRLNTSENKRCAKKDKFMSVLPDEAAMAAELEVTDRVMRPVQNHELWGPYTCPLDLLSLSMSVRQSRAGQFCADWSDF